MAFQLTSTTNSLTQGLVQKPNIVVQIDGVTELLGAVAIQELVRIGADDLLIDGSWRIGGYRDIPEQLTAVSLGTGGGNTTTKVKQQIQQDKGAASSVSNIQIALIDFSEKITEMITPTADRDILGNRAVVYLGYENSDFPNDYIVVFSGIIDSISSGTQIQISVSHPDNKKRQEIFQQRQTELDSGIGSGDTSLDVDNSSGFYEPLPAITYGDLFETYLLIDEEVIEYDGISGNTFTGLTRGQLNTVASTHSSGANVTSFYRLQGSAIDLALYLCLSDSDEYYAENLSIASFESVPNNQFSEGRIYFDSSLGTLHNPVAGDSIIVSGATNTENNFPLPVLIQEVIKTDNEYYLTIYADIVDELPTDAVCSFKSQYNVLPDGLGMLPSEVDIAQHLEIKDQFFSSIPSLDFYLKDTVDGKEFIEQQLYFVSSMYSLPRKGRVSCGITSPPLATSSLPALDSSNVTKPEKTSIKRSINQLYYNNITYKYENDSIEDKYLKGVITIDEDSKNAIIRKNTVFNIEADGLRAGADADTLIRINSRRLLSRYKNAAEKYKCQCYYGTGFNIEIGDIVLFGDSAFQLPDTTKGSRDYDPRLMEVTNKELDILKGMVTLELTDTGYLLGDKFGVVSPSSIVTSGTTTSITVQRSYATTITEKEKDKWAEYIGQKILIHDENWTTQQTTTLLGFDPSDENKMLIDPAITAPLAGYLVDVGEYDDTTASNNILKQSFVHINAYVDVTSGASSTVFDVSDASNLVLGNTIYLRNTDFTSESNEVKIIDITGSTITVDSDLGFTPTSDYFVELIGYSDNEGYRYI